MGRGLFLGVNHALYPKAAWPWRTPILRVILYFCVHGLTQNNQIRRGYTYGDGVFLGGQPRHCISTNALRGLSATAEFPVFLGFSFFKTANVVRWWPYFQ